MSYMYKIILILFFSINAYALTPFSLENLKAVNVKVFDKGKLLSEKKLESLNKEVLQALQEIGIKTSSERFTNFLIKIDGKKSDENKAVLHVSLFIVESMQIERSKKTDAIGFGYYKADFFTSEDIEIDIIDSVDFLMASFAEQYQQEN